MELAVELRRLLSTSCRNRLFFASSSSASSCWPTQLALLPRLSALLRASLAAALLATLRRVSSALRRASSDATKPEPELGELSPR